MGARLLVSLRENIRGVPPAKLHAPSTPTPTPIHAPHPRRAHGSKEDRGNAESRADSEVRAVLGPPEGSPPGTSPTWPDLALALTRVKSNVMRQVVLDHGMRMDGRGLTDIRPITSRAGPLPRWAAGGSATFPQAEPLS